MPSQGVSPVTESSEEGRSFLQRRVAMFWKVMFFLCLFGVAVGGSGAIVKPGLDFVLTVGLAVEAGAAWLLCRQGQRSIRFSRWVESVALLLNAAGSAVLFRYTFAGFVRDHALLTQEGIVMADAYISMFQLGGTGAMVALRATFIPSVPRHTLALTAAVGTPMILASAFLIPTEHGLAWRALDSMALPWMPGTAFLIWGSVA